MKKIKNRRIVAVLGPIIFEGPDDDMVIMATMFEFLIFFCSPSTMKRNFAIFKGDIWLGRRCVLWSRLFSAEQINKFRGSTRNTIKKGQNVLFVSIINIWSLLQISVYV